MFRITRTRQILEFGYFTEAAGVDVKQRSRRDALVHYPLPIGELLTSDAVFLPERRERLLTAHGVLLTYYELEKRRLLRPDSIITPLVEAALEKEAEMPPRNATLRELRANTRSLTGRSLLVI